MINYFNKMSTDKVFLGNEESFSLIELIIKLCGTDLISKGDMNVISLVR